ncbi:MAG TPA: YoaK family protein [Acidimicrobiales bacterium]|nr:YoaK family protein [Acidimicrobiales bacterium]
MANRRDHAFWTREHQRDALVILLTLITGSIDAIGFTRLGGVFTSVMTGNMVLLGVAAGKGDVSLALHTGIAFLGFVVGSLVGARVAGHAHEDDEIWPRPIRKALVLELAVLLIFATWWEIASAAPAGAPEYAMLSINAVALGVQSAATLRFGVSGLSTTYLTGTLTQLLAGVAKRKDPISGRSALILLALTGGAGFGALLAVDAPRFAPLLPTGVLAFVIVGGERTFHRRAKRQQLPQVAR